MKPARYAVLAAMLPLLAAAADQKKPSARPAPPPAATASVPAPPPAATASVPAPPPAATAIPKEAKQIEPYTWRYTDRQGQIWIYRKTPFGVVRFPEPPAESKPAEVIPEGMTAVEQGDLVRFQRRTPFGVHTWTRKPSEFTGLERLVWERDRPQGAPAKSNPQE